MINYDLNKIKAIIFDVDGVLSLETAMMLNDGQPQRSVNVKDGYAIQLAQKMGLRIAIITGAVCDSIKQRYAYLGVEDIYLKSSIKMIDYNDFKQKHNLNDDEIIYMGDDIPDYEVMNACGCACCPCDASPEIKDISLYISHRKGGDGCARDVIEQTLRAQNKWMKDKKAFGW